MTPPSSPPSASGKLTSRSRSGSRHRLHNFTLPTWGIQRTLLCETTTPVVTTPAPANPTASSSSSQPQLPAPVAEDAVTVAVTSPWNLRTRRLHSSFKEPNAADALKSPPAVVTRSHDEHKGKEKEKEEEKMEFSLGLKKEEIEEDFMKMKGVKPSRRPKKRPRVVQKKVDKLFPGMWLCDISEELYKT